MERWKIVVLVIGLIVCVMDLSGIIDVPNPLLNIVVGIILLIAIIDWIIQEKRKEKARGSDK